MKLDPKIQFNWLIEINIPYTYVFFRYIVRYYSIDPIVVDQVRRHHVRQSMISRSELSDDSDEQTNHFCLMRNWLIFYFYMLGAYLILENQ